LDKLPLVENIRHAPEVLTFGPIIVTELVSQYSLVSSRFRASGILSSPHRHWQPGLFDPVFGFAFSNTPGADLFLGLSPLNFHMKCCSEGLCNSA